MKGYCDDNISLNIILAKLQDTVLNRKVLNTQVGDLLDCSYPTYSIFTFKILAKFEEILYELMKFK